jgi:hypothetical protein
VKAGGKPNFHELALGMRHRLLLVYVMGRGNDWINKNKIEKTIFFVTSGSL